MEGWHPCLFRNCWVAHRSGLPNEGNLGNAPVFRFSARRLHLPWLAALIRYGGEMEGRKNNGRQEPSVTMGGRVRVVLV